MDLLDGFGVNFKLLFAQVVNFTILLIVLYIFAYKPVLKMLDERRAKIEESLKNAENIEKEKIEIEEKKKVVLAHAQEEAMQIVSKTREEAVKLKEEQNAKTRREIEKMIEKAKQSILQDREKMMLEVKKEVVELAVVIATKMIEQNLTTEIDEKLIDSATKELKPQ